MKRSLSAFLALLFFLPNPAFALRVQAGLESAAGTELSRFLPPRLAATGTEEKLFLPLPGNGRLAYLKVLPAMPGPRPVALVFHAYGMSKEDPVLRTIAARLVEKGFAVVLLDFGNHAMPGNGNESGGSWERFSYLENLDQVARLVGHLQADPDLDWSNTSLVGYSYGSFMARRLTAVAYQGDPRFSSIKIRGVVEMAGMISPEETFLIHLASLLKKETDGNRELLDRIDRPRMLSPTNRGREAYRLWQREGFLDLDGRNTRFWLTELYGYNAVEDLRAIPPEVRYLYLIGADDFLISGDSPLFFPAVASFWKALAARGKQAALQRIPNVRHTFTGPKVSADVLLQVADNVTEFLSPLAAAGTEEEEFQKKVTNYLSALQIVVSAGQARAQGIVFGARFLTQNPVQSLGGASQFQWDILGRERWQLVLAIKARGFNSQQAVNGEFLRLVRERQIPLPDDEKKWIWEAAGGAFAGVEEGWVTRTVREEVLQDWEILSDIGGISRTRFEFDGELETALVHGEEGDWWLHFHSNHDLSARTDGKNLTPGFLVKVMNRGKAVRRGEVLVELGNNEDLTRPRLQGFVPLDDRVMPSVQTRLALERKVRDFVRAQMAKNTVKQAIHQIHRYGVVLGAEDSLPLLLARGVSRGERELFHALPPEEFDRKGKSRQDFYLDASRTWKVSVTFQVLTPPAAGSEEAGSFSERYTQQLARLLQPVLLKASNSGEGGLVFLGDSSTNEESWIFSGTVPLFHLHLELAYIDSKRNAVLGIGLLIVPKVEGGQIAGIRNVLIESLLPVRGEGDEILYGFYADLQRVLAGHPKELRFFIQQLELHLSAENSLSSFPAAQTSLRSPGDLLQVSEKPGWEGLFYQQNTIATAPAHFRDLQEDELLRATPPIPSADSISAGVEEGIREIRRVLRGIQLSTEGGVGIGPTQARLQADTLRVLAPLLPMDIRRRLFVVAADATQGEFLAGHKLNASNQEVVVANRLRQQFGEAGIPLHYYATQSETDLLTEAMFVLWHSDKLDRFQVIRRDTAAELRTFLQELLAGLMGIEPVQVGERVNLDRLTAAVDLLIKA